MAHQDTERPDTEAGYAAELIALHAASGEPFTLRIEGYSMGSCIRGACEARVDPNPRAVRLGDVVLVQVKGGLVAHRVIARARSHSITTKGDGCFHADHPASVGDVVGRVTGIVREGRLVVPLHWRRPLSALVAVLSRLEALLWPRFSYPLRVLHRAWRLRGSPLPVPEQDEDRSP